MELPEPNGPSEPTLLLRAIHSSDASHRFPPQPFQALIALSFQRPLHLSLAVLVRYRARVKYLALDEVYHPLALSSQTARL